MRQSPNPDPAVLPRWLAVLSLGALALFAVNAVLAVGGPVAVAALAALALVPLLGAVADRADLRARLLGSESVARDHGENRRRGRPERAD